MKKTFQISFLFLLSILFIQCTDDEVMPMDEEPSVETLTDIDGNVYQTVVIGNQTWMVENLKTKTFNDGEAIPEWMFGDSWHNLNNPQVYYQWADTSDLNDEIEEDLPEGFYGALYNEMSLASGKLAPEGWRIPTAQDFRDLEAFLATDGHDNTQAIALKSNSGWSMSSGNGTDNYGFNVLPNGYAAAGGTATGAGIIATLATSDIDSEAKTRTVINFFDEPSFSIGDNSWALGAGVRCIKE